MKIEHVIESAEHILDEKKISDKRVYEYTKNEKGLITPKGFTEIIEQFLLDDFAPKTKSIMKLCRRTISRIIGSDKISEEDKTFIVEELERLNDKHISIINKIESVDNTIVKTEKDKKLFNS